jgi:glycosyltransferase involved in cell wall biosynthesis
VGLPSEELHLNHCVDTHGLVHNHLDKCISDDYMGERKSAEHLKIEEYYVIDACKIKPTNQNRFDECLPTVSFVIPAKNSTRTLDNCLSSIRKQNYPYIEIIVVDNGSTDNTVDIARKYADKVLFDSGKLGRVRQTGIESATGEIIGIFDSDIYLPHKNWLVDALAFFNCANNIATVWPKNIAPPNRPLFQRMYLNFGNLVLEDRIKRQRGIVGGGCALILKSAFLNVGGYDDGVHWGEDFNLAQKLKNYGYMVVYIRDPIYHDTDMGLSIEKFVTKQIMGAKMLSKNNFEEMNLTKWDLLYENTIIGVKGMIRGLIIERDISWILLPCLLLIRAYIALYIFLESRFVNNQRKDEEGI